MQHVDLMDEFRETKLQDLRRQIECGEYVVDPTAVAASLVRRVWGFDVTPEPPEASRGRERVISVGAATPPIGVQTRSRPPEQIPIHPVRPHG
jgi:hypothetical protein